MRENFSDIHTAARISLYELGETSNTPRYRLQHAVLVVIVELLIFIAKRV